MILTISFSVGTIPYFFSKSYANETYVFDTLSFLTDKNINKKKIIINLFQNINMEKEM